MMELAHEVGHLKFLLIQDAVSILVMMELAHEEVIFL